MLRNYARGLRKSLLPAGARADMVAIICVRIKGLYGPVNCARRTTEAAFRWRQSMLAASSRLRRKRNAAHVPRHQVSPTPTLNALQQLGVYPAVHVDSVEEAAAHRNGIDNRAQISLADPLRGC